MADEELKHDVAGGTTLAPLLLRLRRAPVRARGRVTFERILDTTARLLDEHGVERISTNLIASRAGVNIATLYKYFPNKLSVINALFEHQMRQRVADALAGLQAPAATGDWRVAVDAIVDGISAARNRQPGNGALRRAMLSSPELRLIHDAMSREVAALLARWIAQGQRIRGAEAERMARCAVEMLSALLDLAEGEAQEERDRLHGEARRALKAYLAPCFDG